MMSNEQQIKLKRSLILHEDKRNYPYFDTAQPPNITIGIGYNLSARGLPDTWINNQYQEDANYFYEQLSKDFDWFNRLNEDRQIVLIDMCWMGYKKFCTFKKMIAAIAREDFNVAADELLDSKYGREETNRAKVLAEGLRSGIYNI